MTDRWSIGVLIGLPCAAILLLLALVALLYGLYLLVTDEYGDGGFFTICGLGGLILVIAGTLLFMWPLKAEYHRWQHQSGTITQVSSRLLGDDKSTTQRFVVRFDNGKQRSCDDTRCALLKASDHLDLSCKRAWQWSGTPGWDCNYVKSSADAQ